MRRELIYCAHRIRQENGIFTAREAVPGPQSFEFFSKDLARVQEAIEEIWAAERKTLPMPGWFRGALVSRKHARIDLDSLA
ncbi:hypothetical protein M446_6740 [Methylobacterium sp. 4-46]|nr:hypothetical protein M446_6740 [Methylobacterium sp. 4-46]